MTDDAGPGEALVPLRREHVHGVRLIAVCAAELEGTLATVAGSLVAPSGPGFFLALGQSFDNNAQMSLGLADAGATTPDLALELRRVFDRCRELYAKRHQVVHGYWMANSAGQADNPEHESIRVRRW